MDQALNQRPIGTPVSKTTLGHSGEVGFFFSGPIDRA